MQVMALSAGRDKRADRAGGLAGRGQEPGRPRRRRGAGLAGLPAQARPRTAGLRRLTVAIAGRARLAPSQADEAAFAGALLPGVFQSRKRTAIVLSLDGVYAQPLKSAPDSFLRRPDVASQGDGVHSVCCDGISFLSAPCGAGPHGRGRRPGSWPRSASRRGRRPGRRRAGAQGGAGRRRGRGGPGGRRRAAAAARRRSPWPRCSRTFTDPIEVLGVAKGRQSVTLTAATTQLVDQVRFTDGQSVPQGRGADRAEEHRAGRRPGPGAGQARPGRAGLRALEDARPEGLRRQGRRSTSTRRPTSPPQADVDAAQARQADRDDPRARSPASSACPTWRPAPWSIPARRSSRWTTSPPSASISRCRSATWPLIREGQPIAATRRRLSGPDVPRPHRQARHPRRRTHPRDHRPGRVPQSRPAAEARHADPRRRSRTASARRWRRRSRRSRCRATPPSSCVRPQGQRTVAEQRPVVTGAAPGRFRRDHWTACRPASGSSPTASTRCSPASRSRVAGGRHPGPGRPGMARRRAGMAGAARRGQGRPGAERPAA